MAKKKTGPSSLDDLYGEPFTDLKFKLTESQLQYLKEQAKKGRMSVAEYIRRLIDRDRGAG